MRPMAKVDLPYVQTFKDRHGQRRYYYRRKGYERVALPPPESPDFWQSYDKASKIKREIGRERTLPKTVDAAVLLYYRSAEFGDLQPQTKASYRNTLDRFRNKYGTMSAVTLKTRHLNTIFAGMAKTPGAAKGLRKRLRPVFRLVVAEGWRDDNPVTESRTPKVTTKGGFKPWTEVNIASFRERWPSGSRERMALELILNTLARRSDARRLGRQHLDRGGIGFVQQKTGEPVWLPILPELQREIDLAPPGMTFLLTQYGAPFTDAGFTQWFGEKADAAEGCAGLTPHGLRKAGARRLAEAGCSAKQIAAALGHTSTKEAETYTKDADQAKLAKSAFENLTRTGAVNP
jgi:integrase